MQAVLQQPPQIEEVEQVFLVPVAQITSTPVHRNLTGVAYYADLLATDSKMSEADFARLKAEKSSQFFIDLADRLQLEVADNFASLSTKYFEMQLEFFEALYKRGTVEQKPPREEVAFVLPEYIVPLNEQERNMLHENWQRERKEKGLAQSELVQSGPPVVRASDFKDKVAKEAQLNIEKVTSPALNVPLTAEEQEQEEALLLSTQEQLQKLRTHMLVSDTPVEDVALVDSARVALQNSVGQGTRAEQLTAVRNSVGLNVEQANLITSMQTNPTFFNSFKAVVGAGMAAGIFSSLITLIGTGSFIGLGPLLLVVLGAMGIEAVRWVTALLNRFVVPTTETEVEQFKQGDQTLQTKIAASPAQSLYKKLPNFNLAAGLYALMSVFVLTFMFRYVLQDFLGASAQGAVAFLTGTVASQLNSFALSSLSAWAAQAIRTGVSEKLLKSERLGEKTKAIIKSWGPIAEGFLLMLLYGGANYAQQMLAQTMPTLSIKEQQQLIEEIKSTPVEQVGIDTKTVQVNGQSFEAAFTLAQDTSPVMSLAQAPTLSYGQSPATLVTQAVNVFQQTGVTQAVSLVPQTQVEQAVKTFVIDGAAQLRQMTPKSAATKEALQTLSTPSLSWCWLMRYFGPLAIGGLATGGVLVGTPLAIGGLSWIGAGLWGASTGAATLASTYESYAVGGDQWVKLCEQYFGK